MKSPSSIIFFPGEIRISAGPLGRKLLRHAPPGPEAAADLAAHPGALWRFSWQKIQQPTGWGPPVISWFISDLTMVYGRYNYSSWGL